jgi:hypothetical protein
VLLIVQKTAITRLKLTMKSKLNHPKTALSALLLLTTSFAYATPTVSTDTLDDLWQWLLPDAQQPKSQVACESFPSCPPPDFAPAPEPKKPGDKK